MTPTDLLTENSKRRAILNAPYDPITGEGSPIPRFPFRVFQDSDPIMLPETMKELPFVEHAALNSLEEYAETTDDSLDEWIDALNDFRFDHDFEYWAFTTVKIRPDEGGDLIRLRPKRAQRKIIATLETMRRNGTPIRIILLKARQNGGSTIIQVYMSWIQLRHMTNWHSLIAAHINQAASNIRNMYTVLVDNYPLADYKLKPFENTQNSKIIHERSNKITIGSMQNPDSIRSDNTNLLHGSEIGLMKKTEGKEPEDLLQAAMGTVKSLPLTMIALESTAKGVGNYFHRTWLAANRTGKDWNKFVPVFVAWWEVEMYQTNFESEEARDEFVESMDSYELSLWTQGATLEGINWYRNKLAESNGNRWRMCSEFPSNAIEAFQSTGQRVFAPAYVTNMRKHCEPPAIIGDIYPSGTSGKAAFEGLEFKATSNGLGYMWAEPNDPPSPPGKIIRNRYALWADIGGRTEKADNSAISVIDRYWMLEGGVPERVFTWLGHIDQDLFVWKAAQIAKFYNDALFAFEVNRMSLDRQTSEGSHDYTLLDEIADFYDNIFTRSQPENIREGVPVKYGFHTNHASKTMLTDNFNKILREQGYIEKDERAAAEADTYEIKLDGSFGAVSGSRDDLIFTTFGAVWLATSYMEPPKIVDLTEKNIRPIVRSLVDF